MSRLQERILDSAWLSVITLILMFVIAVAAVGAVGNVYAKYECSAKTESIGFDSRYSFLGGCQIEVTDGQWIPLDNYYFKQQ
jgi:hypothetical protein